MEQCLGNQSDKNVLVALSTTEAEFIAATEACKELLSMRRFLQELGLKQERYVLYCDSQSAIHLSKNPSFHSRSILMSGITGFGMCWTTNY